MPGQVRRHKRWWTRRKQINHLRVIRAGLAAFRALKSPRSITLGQLAVKADEAATQKEVRKEP